MERIKIMTHCSSMLLKKMNIKSWGKSFIPKGGATPLEIGASTGIVFASNREVRVGTATSSTTRIDEEEMESLRDGGENQQNDQSSVITVIHTDSKVSAGTWTW